MSLRLGTKIVAGNAVVVPENIYLKTTYDGGTSGYRIWSDGYCEQWGLATSSSTSSSTATISYLKKFKDTNYILVGGLHSSSTSSTNAIGVAIGYNLTVDGFTCNVNSTYPKHWLACGYLASGQY